MDKKRLELIITVILIIVFAVVLTNSFKKIKPKAPSIKKQVSAETLPAQKVEPLFKAKRETLKGEIIETKELGWGRDPFTLQEVSQGVIETIENLKLMGITVGEKTKSMAIINNEIVTIGSKIGKFTVLRISPNKVIVNDGEKNFELKMK